MCVQHILICPFGWLGKNIMPLPGLDGGMERQGERRSSSSERFGGRGRDWEKWGLKEERMTAVRDGDEARLFLTFPSLSQHDELPSKRPAGIEHR